MKTQIHEIGVIDIEGAKHPVNFQKGLNIVTGKSSTGKSAIIDIYDYVFASEEYNVPQGVITKHADIYYLLIEIEDKQYLLAREAKSKKGFFRNADGIDITTLNRGDFVAKHFRPLPEYKKHLRDLFQIDIDNVDESITAKSHRYNNAKAKTPTVRSFSSFVLQHQNLVANRHALFYRFDQKEKRDLVIEDTKIFLGLVDQNYFHLSQQLERLTYESNKLAREQQTNVRLASLQKRKIQPVLGNLYSMMGFKEEPLKIQNILRDPRNSKASLDKIIKPEKIDHQSDEVTNRYNKLKEEQTLKTAELRKLQNKASSIKKHIRQEEEFSIKVKHLNSPDSVQIGTSICPFCSSEQTTLEKSAVKLKAAIEKVTLDVTATKPMKAKFNSLLLEVEEEISIIKKDLAIVGKAITDIENVNKALQKKKSLYESILISKATLFSLLDSIELADDEALAKRKSEIDKDLRDTERALNKYDVKKGLETASEAVNSYMAEIGQGFDFEDTYQPINLKFSFETFDLYHESENGEKIYLRSMGSGANWLYCHITLFLAMHKYFVELGNMCSIPSVLFLDQPTQVYFPNFNRDSSDSFEEVTLIEQSQRTEKERTVDEDVKAVETLFSKLSEYCIELELSFGYSPQIIVADHADQLTLSNGVEFESLVNSNRWRERGLIHPVPS